MCPTPSLRHGSLRLAIHTSTRAGIKRAVCSPNQSHAPFLRVSSLALPKRHRYALKAPSSHHDLLPSDAPTRLPLSPLVLQAHLELPPLPSNLPHLPLLRELLVQPLQLLHKLIARLHHRLLGRHLAIRLHAQLEDREERVRDLVGGEEDVRRAGQLVAEQVAESVVFFVEGEEGCVGDA